MIRPSYIYGKICWIINRSRIIEKEKERKICEYTLVVLIITLMTCVDKGDFFFGKRI